LGAVESLGLGGVLDVRAGSQLLLCEEEADELLSLLLGVYLSLPGKGLENLVNAEHRVGIDAKHLADGVLELQGVHFPLNELLNVFQR